jgi:hypothetical protein
MKQSGMMNRTTRYTLAFAAVTALAFSAVGCSDETTTQPVSKAGTFYGSTVNVGSGTARSWVTLDNNGNPTAIGLAMTDSALLNLPSVAFPPTEYVLPLPAQASATAYNHIGLDWNLEGHPPAPIYTKPHFDMHFYTISAAERDMINPADTAKVNKMPGADYIPAGYTLPPGPAIEAVPRMGVHWGDLTSHEFHGSEFDKTFIYGFWNGDMIFAEPMITVAYLQSKASFTENLKLPAKYPKANLYYATKYSIKYDTTKKEHIVALEGLTKR